MPRLAFDGYPGTFHLVRKWAFVVVSVFALSALACRRHAETDGTPLYAPFNVRKPIATLNWRVDGEHYEVAVRSLMAGRVALRVERIAVANSGPPLAGEGYECLLAGGVRARLLSGPLPGGATGLEANLDIAVIAIPLDQPGRLMYREWAWIRRPNEVAAIDAELTRLDALPACAAESVAP